MKPWQNDIFNLYVEQRGRAGRNVGKYHPKLKGTRQDVRTAGLSVPSRDAPNFIATLLYNLNIFDDAEADSIIRATTSPERGESLMQSLEDHSDEIRERQDEISNAYEEELTKYVNRAKINRGRGGKGSKGRTDRYEAQAAAIEMAKQQKELLKQMKSQGVDAATSIEDAILNSMESSKDETLVSMQIKDLTDADGLIDTIEKLGVDKSDIGVERVPQGVVVDFFISTNSRIGRDFESIPPTEIDDMFSRFSSSGEVVVEVLPPDDISDAITGLKSSLSRPDRESKGETYDEPEKQDSEAEFDPETSGEIPTVSSADADEDARPTEDDFDDVGVAYDPSYDKDDADEFDMEGSDYDPMNPYDEDRYENEEGEHTCEECDGKGHKNYPHEGEMEYDTCRSCGGSGKTNKPSHYGEDEEGDKPDFLDLDGDGDKEESMKQAAKDADKNKKETNHHGDENNEYRERRDPREPFEDMGYTEDEDEDIVYEDIIDGDEVKIKIERRFTGDEWVVSVTSKETGRVGSDINKDKDKAFDNAVREYKYLKRATPEHLGDEDIMMMGGYEGNEENINEGHKMSPQQANQWMTQQRNERVRNYMKHDERWKGYY